MSNVEIEINKLLDNANEDISILCKDIKNNKNIYYRNECEKIISASTIKVQIMLAILEKIKQTQIILTDQIFVNDIDILEDTNVFEQGKGYYIIEELLNWMIIKSDNTATNVLIEKVGFDYINKYIKNELKLE